MTPREVIEACKVARVKLRINPDGRLTANPRRRLSDELVREINANRPAILEIIEARQKEAEGFVDDTPPPPPPEPPLGIQIITRAAAEGVEIFLDEPSQRGRMSVRTQMDPVLKQPKQLPTWLQSALGTHQREILEVLRSPYYPPLDPSSPQAQLSIWEKLAGRVAPDIQENRRLIKDFLSGGPMPDQKTRRQQAALNEALPSRVIRQR
jgi:hypothetical protein